MATRATLVLCAALLALLGCSNAGNSPTRDSGYAGSGDSNGGGDPGNGGAGGSGTAGAAGVAQGGSGGAEGGVPATLILPIEVLSDGSPATPLVVDTQLRLDSASLASASQLWIECHRCGFYGDPEYEATSAAPTKIKASFRVLGGSTDDSVPWIDITDQNVVLAGPERVQGGVNGGLFTTQMSVALDTATRARLVALPGLNKIQFRFNGTDGASNGFRILDLALQSADGKDVGADLRGFIDPNVEKLAGAVPSDDVALGQALWYAQNSLIKSVIVKRTIIASCSSCHAPDGRDLQYFGYSNNAIVKRSQFHGLSETQGKQIATFLRYTLRNVPNAPLGRPWNPPYQPGPGLDAAPANWAAGAGLGAVLTNASDGLKALFGKDVKQPLALSQADIDAVMTAKGTLNVREIAIPMQFPDWNAWLPTIHPLDVWPDTGAKTGSFLKGGVFGNGSKNPLAFFKQLTDWLDSHQDPNGMHGDYSHLTPDQRVQVQGLMTNSGWETYNFLGGGRGGHEGPDPNNPWGAQVGASVLQARADAATTSAGLAGAFSYKSFIERSTSSLLHWLAVEQWGLVQQYGLEGNQANFIGDKDSATGAWKGRGEALGWPFNAPSTFYLAPHMLYEQDGTRENYFAWEQNDIVGSYYRTNQWYQLQMTINAGGQSGWSNYPMDWPYLTGFDALLGQTVGDDSPEKLDARATHFVRLVEGQIKSAQYVDNSLGLDDGNSDITANVGRYGRGQALKHLDPSVYMDTGAQFHTDYRFLAPYQTGLQLLIVNGAFSLFNDLYATTTADAWRRCDPSNLALGGPEPFAGFRYCLDKSVDPLLKDGNGVYYLQPGQTTSAQSLTYSVWKAQQLGVESGRLATFSAWVDRMW